MEQTAEQRAGRQTLEVALRLACAWIADGPQTYEEANTAEGWASVFIEAADSGKTPADVIRGRLNAAPAL